MPVLTRCIPESEQQPHVWNFLRRITEPVVAALVCTLSKNASNDP